MSTTKSREEIIAGAYFKEGADETDPHYRVIELRLPIDPEDAAKYPPRVTYGAVTVQRLRLFCAAFLVGAGDIGEEHANAIREHAEGAIVQANMRGDN